MGIIILSISTLLQYLSAFLAIRMSRITGFSIAWVLLASAIFLMAVRRSITLGKNLSSGLTIDPSSELVALSISVIMTVALINLGPLLKKIQKNKKLEEASKNLELMVEKLMASNSDLERFAYMASHDLQEPLRMVSNFSHLLQNDYSDKLDSEGKYYLEMCYDSSIRMQEMVSDILDYSRVSNQNSIIEEIDLNETLAVVRENLKESIESSGAVIEHTSLPRLRIERIHASQLLQNLISNSIKYQKANNTPVITIRAEEKEDSVLLSVEDNGIGISDKDKSEIFQPFKRLHAYSQYEGTGIGLAICKKIIEKAGGKIMVESILGTGTTFNLIFPKQIKNGALKDV